MSLKKTIDTIPYTKQRYPTCGDYYRIHEEGESGWTTKFLVNNMGNEDYEFLVSIHEQIEEHLTRKMGVTERAIMAFDIAWEKERKKGKHGENDEPGHDARAPYHDEHVTAENIERILADAMGVCWPSYEAAVIKSCKKKHPSEND